MIGMVFAVRLTEAAKKIKNYAVKLKMAIFSPLPLSDYYYSELRYNSRGDPVV